MKKTLLLLVALITATIAFAQKVEIDGIYYNLNDETKTANVTSVSDWFENSYTQPEITIPQNIVYNGEEYSVVGIECCTFSNSTSLISFITPENITHVDLCVACPYFSASEWFTNQLDGCVYIGKCLYKYKGNMPAKSHIDVKDGTTQICGFAFDNCSNLFSITIPSSVTSIDDWAFANCNNLSSITCLGATPPNAYYLEGYEEDNWKIYNTCILFVPKDALDDYKSHAVWGKFLNIQELDVEKYTITTTVNDDIMGVVIGGGEYKENTEITLTATANSGYRFVKWSDEVTDNPRIVTVTENKTYTAEFEVETFTITTASEVPSMGGVKVTLTAEPIEGFEFVEWTDGNTDNPRILTLTENIEVYARFQIAQGGTPVDIETSKISSANIYTTNGTLHIEGATENYHILDAAGRLIYSGNATTLTLPRGIYLVTINGEVEKIVL